MTWLASTAFPTANGETRATRFFQLTPFPARSANCFSPLGNQRGVALMGVLLMVVIMGLGAAVAGTTWKTRSMRDKEEELLWRGNQYRLAIASYYQGRKAGAQGTFPREIERLEKDPRFLKKVRHIRRLYKDPITGEDFVLIKDPAKGIIGVRSASEEEPFKKDGFPTEYAAFVGKSRYSDWQFIFKPKIKSNPHRKTPRRSASPFNRPDLP